MIRRVVAIFVTVLLAAPAVAQDAPRGDEPAWAFEASDLPIDPAFVFGRLENGMRYVVRRNATPAGTALVRLRVGSGSLAESDGEQGLAHFVEHMAFNGTAHVPEGEMVRLLEREGLAFGADTNASTGFLATTYKLDLPRVDEALIDTALFLMRETASEMTIAPAAVARERGVVLAERRDRNTFALRNTIDDLAFAAPGARYAERLPIGERGVLETADADALRAFYEREYVPANATLIVVGDIDPAAVETKIRDRFGDWRAAPLAVEPASGPIGLDRIGETDVYIDPALSERITVFQHRAFDERPDTVAGRADALLRRLGYGVVNRRLARLAQREDAPFRAAGFGTGAVFEDARVTRLVVDTSDDGWARGLAAAVAELRRALEFGFTRAELDEQLATIQTAQENAVAGAATRSNVALAAAALRLVEDERVPTTPASGLERLRVAAERATPDAVLAALRADIADLSDPLIRFQGRRAPEGGAEAVRAVFRWAAATPVEPPAEAAAAPFAYTGFGPPGAIVSDETDAALGIRRIRFANHVRLNLKRTDLAADRVAFALAIDGGDLLNTAADPLATAMTGALANGGLGRHSADALQTALAGRSVGYGLSSGAETFRMGATTTPRDLDLQLRLAAALVIDPGYRAEGEQRYRRSVARFFANLDATPARALSLAQGGIVSDGDPRFTLQPRAAYDALSYDRLDAAIGERLANGAIEIGLVGDLDPAAAIAAVAASFGALPEREAEFRERPEARRRAFTADRSPRTLTHTGAADQALLRLVWPTADDDDPAETVALGLLARVLRLELTDALRERLGQAYSPSAASAPSAVYDDYGTFTVTAALDAGLVDEAREAVLGAVSSLRATPPAPDLLARARRPALERVDNALKTNRGWAALVNRAQTEPERIERFLALRERIEAVTPADLRALALRYLDPAEALEIRVLPSSGAAAGERDRVTQTDTPVTLIRRGTSRATH